MVTCIAGEVAQVDLSSGHLDLVDSTKVSLGDGKRVVKHFRKHFVRHRESNSIELRVSRWAG